MSKYAAAESIKAQIAKLETLFDKMVDGEMLSNELAGIPTQWGVA